MKISTPVAAIALIAAGAATPAFTQTQDAASAAALGQINYTYNNSRPTPAANQVGPLQVKGVKIRDLILATPALRVRRGFALHTSVVLKTPVGAQAGGADVIIGDILLRFVQVSRSRPNARGEYPGNGEGPAILYSINTMMGLNAVEAGKPFVLPRDLQTRGGVTTYSRNGDDFLMLHKPGRTPFRSMTMGEYYTYLIDENAGLVAEAKANGYTGMEKTAALVDRMRAELAALTGAERAAPACEIYSRTPAPCQRANAKPIGVIEAGFFKSKPRSSARLITLEVRQQPKRAQDFNSQLVPLRNAMSQLDVGGLQTLLD